MLTLNAKFGMNPGGSIDTTAGVMNGFDLLRQPQIIKPTMAWNPPHPVVIAASRYFQHPAH
jgi:hypothetical protein